MRRVAVLAFGLASALFACQIVAGIERVEKVPPPVADAVAPDAEPDAPVDPCDHARPPSRPQKSATPGEDEELPPFILAFRTLTILPPKGAPAPGYDLDGVCTCETRQPTVLDGGSSCVVGAKTPICDGDGGVDNQMARLLNDYRELIQIDEAANVNDEIAQGARSLLFQITGYNGLPNDPSISVGVFGSEGILQQSPPHSGCDASIETPFADRPDGATVWTPSWCGDDTWSIVKETALGESRPPLPVRTGSGWVKDGVLVVEITDSVQVPFLTTVISLATARIVAKLTPLGEDLKPRDPNVRPRTEKEKRLFAMDEGVFAGRISARDLLAVSGTFDDPLDKQSGVHLCNTVLFDQIKDRFCEYLDIASSTQRDQNLAYACDAISGGFGFSAFPALDGPYEPRLPNENECTAGPGDRPIDASRDVIYACPLPDAGP